MSIKSTHSVTKQHALNIIYSNLNNQTDEQISDILETVINNKFYNFQVVDKLEENDYLTITDSNYPSQDGYY